MKSYIISKEELEYQSSGKISGLGFKTSIQDYTDSLNCSFTEYNIIKGILNVAVNTQALCLKNEAFWSNLDLRNGTHYPC
jgi:hypothetical protein